MTNPQSASFEAFDFGDRLGLVFVVQGATLSILAITSLLAYITYSTVTIRLGATRRWSTDTHIHYYFLNLMVFDLIQALGGMFDTAWIHAAGIYPGPVCDAQGVFKHVGNTGAAFSTIAITLHTMVVLVMRWKTPPRTALLGTFIIWLLVGLMAGIPNAIVDNFYGPTGHWCWIERNNFQRIGLQYLWMWVAAFLSLVVYIFVALVVRRIIVVDRYGWCGIRFQTAEIRSISPRVDSSDSQSQRDEGAIALRMLFYPGVYIITVLPITAARFTEFNRGGVPWPVTAWADTLLLLSGFFNTILYTLTRPKLLPKRSQQTPSRLVLSSTPQQIGRKHRFHYHPDDSKVEDGELPPMSFELRESEPDSPESLRCSSELRFVHPDR